MADPLLRRYVEAPDEEEAERALDALVEQRALPLARAIVERKLKSYRTLGPGRADAHDRDDVVGNAMVTIVERLRAARRPGPAAPIENFASYAATVVHSACAHHIRRCYPERARLKNRLRYVFTTERRLALWTTSDDELVCGLAEWSGAPPDSNAERMLRSAIEREERAWAALTRPDITAALIAVLNAARGPVEFDVLVSTAAAAAHLVEPRYAVDAALEPSREPTHDVVIDQRRRLARVWEEVGNLPVRQRVALLLNLRDVTGGGLLWLLPIAGVATLRQIARLLEIQDSELARLWRDIPLDDAAIGERLGCTRQQVINLRMSARKRLVNRVGTERAGALRPAGNLVPFSASLKGSA